MTSLFKKTALRLGALAALGFVAAAANAVERTVPGDHATIALALAAASDGDVIRITDSGVYTEQLVINKSVQIIADQGANPIIRTDPSVTAGAAVIVTTGAQGGKFGSLGGGRITVDRNILPSATTTNLHGILVNGILATQTYTIENVRITGFTTGGVTMSEFTGYDASNGLKGTLYLTVVEIDGGHTPADFTSGAAQTGVRVTGSNNTILSNSGATIIMNRVWVHDVNSHAMILNNSTSSHLRNVTVQMETCEMTTLQHGALQMGNNPGINVTINNSFLLGGGPQSSWGALRYSTANNTTYGPPGGTISVTNSVLTVYPLAGAAGVIGMSQSGQSNNLNFLLDHCDIINEMGGGASVDDQLPRPRHAVYFNTGDNRTLTFTNNNIYGPDVATTNTLTGFYIVAGAADVITAHHNNVFVSGEAYTGVTPGAGEVIPGVDPGYVDEPNRDYRVTNPALQTASSTGGVIGSNSIFSNFVPVELSSFSVQ